MSENRTTKWVDRGYTHPPDSSHYGGTSYFVEESNMSEAPQPTDLTPGDYAYLAAAIQCLTATRDGDNAALARALNYAAIIEDKYPDRVAALQARVKEANDAIWR